MRDYREIQWWASSGFPQLDLKFIKIDARVMICLLPICMYYHILTLSIALGGIVIFTLFGYLGYPVPVAYKLFKMKLAGKRRSISTNKKRRKTFTNG
jgi:hypothetical protein